MARKSKKEAVSLSFHYLVRMKENEDGEPVEGSFSKSDLETVYQELLEIKNNDVNYDEAKSKKAVRINKLDEMENDSTITGVYDASYWGHSYDNSDKGKIEASSINWRPFFFMLYLSESGRIYLASQYLGHFGGYTSLKNTVLRILPNSDNVEVMSFNFGNEDIENAIPKRVEIQYSKKGETITSKNTLGTTGVLVFQKETKDDGFEKEVTSTLLDNIGSEPRYIRKIIASLLTDSVLMEINDNEIEDCKVIAVINGRTKTIQMFDEYSYATKIHVDVPLTEDGHPQYKYIKEETIRILGEEIIARREDV